MGVADSKSLISVSDVLTTELDDPSLHEICRLKSNGSSLSAFACLREWCFDRYSSNLEGYFLWVSQYLGVCVHLFTILIASINPIK